MHITTYHIHNVLKAYGKQLSLSRRAGANNHGVAPNRTDSITISSEARRKAVIEKVAEDVVERIMRFGPRDPMEQDVFKELEGEYGNNLAVGDSAELVFKVIDKENGECVMRFPIWINVILTNLLWSRLLLMKQIIYFIFFLYQWKHIFAVTCLYVLSILAKISNYH